MQSERLKIVATAFVIPLASMRRLFKHGDMYGKEVLFENCYCCFRCPFNLFGDSCNYPYSLFISNAEDFVACWTRERDELYLKTVISDIWDKSIQSYADAEAF